MEDLWHKTGAIVFHHLPQVSDRHVVLSSPRRIGTNVSRDSLWIFLFPLCKRIPAPLVAVFVKTCSTLDGEF